MSRRAFEGLPLANVIRRLLKSLRRTRATLTPRQQITQITKMLRNPPQLAVLARSLPNPADQPCRFAVHGVADGCEAVSLLATVVPTDTTASSIDLRIEGFDNNPVWLAMARRMTFTRAQLPSEPPAALDRFLRRGLLGRRFTLRPCWRSVLRFAEHDVRRPLADGRQYDLVTCQNVLIHMPAEDVSKTIDRLVAQVVPGGVLAIGGGPLDLVPRLVMARGLEPILEEVETIHESWSVQRKFFHHEKPPYWALEPFDAAHPDGPQRYCTLFRAS